MIPRSLLFCSLLFLGACHTESVPKPADWVILNAHIRTMNPAQPIAQALAISDQKILFVGNSTQATHYIGPNTRLLRLHGETVLPGLIDSHIHVVEGGLAENTCRLGDQKLSFAQIKEKIQACEQRHPTQGWLLVNEFNGAGLNAHATQLDAINNTRPLLLAGSDGHTAWVNSKGLQAAGITHDTKDPPSGHIERNADGQATGFLVDEAVNLAYAAQPKASVAQRMQAIRESLPRLHAVGITGFLEANTPEENFQAFYALAKERNLNARVSLARSSHGITENAPFAHWQQQKDLAAKTATLRADFIKLFADGVLEYPTQSAALLAPYTDASGKPTENTGRLYIPAPTMSDFVKTADHYGFGVHIHAIGDAAVHESLNAFEAARKKGSTRPYSIAHLQLIAPSDYPRFSANHVIASLQLLWAQPDNYSVEAIQAYIGKARHARIYPAASLVRAGAMLAGGSDWNVSSFNPFLAMAIAVSRKNSDAPERAPLNSHEAVTLDTMLQAYTLNAARLLGRESEIGSLTVGKKADLVILNTTLNNTSKATEIANTQIAYTFFDGRVVYRAQKPR